MPTIVEDTTVRGPRNPNDAAESQPIAATNLTGPRTDPPSGSHRPFLARLAPFAAAALFAVALWAVHRALADISYGTLWRAIVSLSAGQIAPALLLTLIGYLAL